MDTPYHDPVLRVEAISYLISDPDGIYVDATVGGGGHAELISRTLGTQGRLLCFDADDDAIRFSKARLQEFHRQVSFVHSNFRNLRAELNGRGFDRIHGLLLDLGVSSFQLDTRGRGFSFREDEAIDMRMDRRQHLSGSDVVNTYDEEALADILWRYGQERHSRRIARRLVAARPVLTTGALRSVVESAVGGRFVTKTLARVFQAIRIEVNNELKNLKEVLECSPEMLVQGGRIVVITYHSLEDKVVKDFFRREAASRIPSGNKYAEDTLVEPRLKILTRKPIEPAEPEIGRNPRARSAKMRVAERLATRSAGKSLN
jgi:16S rRNA (cytosine1402-N4)-methyltransferase